MNLKVVEKVIKSVFGNKGDDKARYIPKTYNSLGTSWGVWDKIEGAYVRDEKLDTIDPSEKVSIQ